MYYENKIQTKHRHIKFSFAPFVMVFLCTVFHHVFCTLTGPTHNLALHHFLPGLRVPMLRFEYWPRCPQYDGGVLQRRHNVIETSVATLATEVSITLHLIRGRGLIWMFQINPRPLLGRARYLRRFGAICPSAPDLSYGHLQHT